LLTTVPPLALAALTTTKVIGSPSASVSLLSRAVTESFRLQVSSLIHVGLRFQFSDFYFPLCRPVVVGPVVLWSRFPQHATRTLILA
jgi:hypothetical protein